MDTPAYDSFAELFPMPMTSIEKFHWFDDSPALRNVNFFRLRIATKVDADLAKQAWQFTVQRQPFADVEPKKVKGRWCWVAGPRAVGDANRSFETWNGTRFEYVEHPDKPADWKFDEHRIRSATGSYLGVFVWPVSTDSQTDVNETEFEVESSTADSESGFQTELMFFVHHAIGDGAAAVQVVNEWLLIYANLCAGRPAETGIHRLDKSLFRKRNAIGIMKWGYLKHLPHQSIALFGAAKFTFRKTVELIPATPREQVENTAAESSVAESGYPSIVGQWISAEQREKMNLEAKTHNVMLNSVLLGQLYLSLAQWRDERGGHSDTDWMRIILPMSIRNVSDRRLPAANRATIVQIDRCGREMSDVGKFYYSLDREIRIIRGWQLEKIFLVAMRGLSMFETFLKNAASSEKSRGMAVFTNLGEPLRKSERASSREPDSSSFLRPYDFDPVGPVRTGTPANFTVSRYADRFRVSLHYDSQVLTREDAIGLLQVYIDRLNSIG